MRQSLVNVGNPFQEINFGMKGNRRGDLYGRPGIVGYFNIGINFGMESNRRGDLYGRPGIVGYFNFGFGNGCSLIISKPGEVISLYKRSRNKKLLFPSAIKFVICNL